VQFPVTRQSPDSLGAVARRLPVQIGPNVSTLSVVITAHNESGEVERTIESVRNTTRDDVEIIVVDDGSTDGCCASLQGPALRVIRQTQRRGVAPSRNAAVRAASGAVIAFIDAHQRFSPQCLNHCAKVAVAQNAIVWPDVGGFGNPTPLIHGASFCVCPATGAFAARYRVLRPLSRISRITALRAPGYVMPRKVYEQVKWPAPLRGWGASEAAVGLKAFFLGVPILHLCGPLARHLFKESFQYDVDSQGVAWNQAVIARVCFDDRTWHEHWLPHVFARELPASTLRELEAPSIRDEQREFQRRKVRSDRDFWRWLLKLPEPESLRRTSIGVGSIVGSMNERSP
jgi:glycosyltransferase involved in cell wall biosynthesis